MLGDVRAGAAHGGEAVQPHIQVLLQLRQERRPHVVVRHTPVPHVQHLLLTHSAHSHCHHSLTTEMASQHNRMTASRCRQAQTCEDTL